MHHRVVSCYTNSFGPLGLAAAVEHVRSCRLDHLEIALRPHDHGGLVIPESAVITEKTTDGDAERFVASLHQNRIKASACNVAGADLLTIEGVEVTERRIRFARRWLGVGVVVSNAGKPTSPGERATIVEHLRRIGATAQELGMIVALETHKGPTENADAMLGLMLEIDHPAVRLNFDTGNIAYYNRGLDPVGELDRVKHLVANVHLKDNRGGFEDWYFPALGDGGAVDFRAIRATLDGVGYAGAYTIEIEGIGGEAEPGIEARCDRIRRSVEHLVQCGYFDDSTLADLASY